MYSTSNTVGELARKFSPDVELLDAGSNERRWWHFSVLGLAVPCYNFKWRKEAIFTHDLHHIVTGYPCTMRGEMQVAAWEFGAGRCPNLLANLFCLPLIAAGALCIPRKTFLAFRNGRLSKSLFSANLDQQVLDWPFEKLKSLTRREIRSGSPVTEALHFSAWCCLSFLLVSVPFAIAAAGWLLISA